MSGSEISFLGKCEVCRIQDAVGVACTSLPLSVAYCAECAARGADPEIVFACWFDEIGIDFVKMDPVILDNALTFKNGGYVGYREWATARQLPALPEPPHDPT